MRWTAVGVRKRMTSLSEVWFCDWCDEEQKPQNEGGVVYMPARKHYTQAQKDLEACVEPICKSCAEATYPEVFE